MSPSRATAAAPAHLEPTAAPAPARRAGRARLRIASVRPDGRSPLGLVGSVLLGLLFVAVFGVVVLQAMLVQTQARLDGLDQDVVVEQQRAEALHLQLAELRSPERITAAAQERLGMIPPEEVLYLQHDEGDDAAARLEPSPDGAVASGGGGG